MRRRVTSLSPRGHTHSARTLTLSPGARALRDCATCCAAFSLDQNMVDRRRDKRSDLERVAAVGLGLRRVEFVAPLVDFDQVRAELGLDDAYLADGGSANTGGGVGWVWWRRGRGKTQAERTAAAASGAGESRVGSQRGRARGRQSPAAETRSGSQCACQATGWAASLRGRPGLGRGSEGRAHAGLKT